MARWRCDCPICRLLVHPVLRRLGAVGPEGPAVPRAGAPAAPRQPRGPAVEAAPLQPQAGGAPAEAGEAAAPLAAPVKAPQPVLDEELLEGFATKISASVREVVEGTSKVLMERLDRIEENLGKLRKEIQGLVSSMENVIVEFREAISELSNPLYAAQPGAPAGPAAPGQAMAAPVAASGHLEALVRSLSELVEKAGLETVEELLDEYVKAGIIGEDEARRLRAIARTLSKLRGKKVDPSLILPLLTEPAAKGE